MFLTMVGLYAGVSAVYWGFKYANTKSEKAKDAALKNLGSSYLECLKWPVDLVNGVSGFKDPDDKGRQQ